MHSSIASLKFLLEKKDNPEESQREKSYLIRLDSMIVYVCVDCWNDLESSEIRMLSKKKKLVIKKYLVGSFFADLLVQQFRYRSDCKVTEGSNFSKKVYIQSNVPFTSLNYQIGRAHV